MADFDLLILDCDGVLVDSELLAIRTMREVLNGAGIPATDALVLGCFGMKQIDALRHIAAATGCEIPAAVPARIWPATRAAFEAALGPMPGAAAFLRATGDRRRCAASSSDPERIRLSLELTGLLGFFGDTLFSSHEVARGKPAPDLFLHAAARMGAAPARCLVVEDSVFGIAAARAAGMVSLGFTGGSHVGPDHADKLMAAGADGIVPDWPGVLARLAA